MPQQLVTAEEVDRYFEDHPKATIAAAAAHFDVAPSAINRRLAQGAGGREIKLTPFDLSVFDAIVDHVSEYHWPPSVTEVANHVGGSRAAAHASIHRLALSGKLVLGDGARAIRIVGARIDVSEVTRGAG